MSVLEEYQRQAAWRAWDEALARCPLAPGQKVLDLGCGPGEVAAALVARGTSVTGIDRQPELIAAARQRAPQARFAVQELDRLDLPAQAFDALWCSFTAAYLIPFEEWLPAWMRLLKPSAWICVIDIDDLLAHEPLSPGTQQLLDAFADEALAALRYDLCAGRKLAGALAAHGFTVQPGTLPDRELSFQGPASPEILAAWRARLARMGGLHRFLGPRFPALAEEFLGCLSSSAHRTTCSVVCCVGRRG